MQTLRPRPPTTVKKPLPLLAAGVLFLALCGLRAIPAPSYMVRAWLIEPMFPFAAVAALALLAFPARRFTYAITCFCLAAVLIDVVALAAISFTDAMNADFQFNWLIPVSGWAALSGVVCAIFFLFSLGRRTRRYYGFLDPAVRVKINHERRLP